MGENKRGMRLFALGLAVVCSVVAQLPSLNMGNPNPFLAPLKMQEMYLQAQAPKGVQISNQELAQQEQMLTISNPGFGPELPVDINGLPAVPQDQVLEEYAKLKEQASLASQPVASDPINAALRPMDLEEVGFGSPNPQNFGPHWAVPKLQKWLTAMNPMKYAAPSFTNPVAKQVFGRLSDKSLPRGERERLMRLVSSPYMFQMLGNPAYEDPQLWSGLVSGSAVPFPLRNAIMAQRTALPFRLASTGTIESPTDAFAQNFYEHASKTAPQGQHPHHTAQHARHRLHKIFSALNKHTAHSLTKIQPTPHKDEAPVEEELTRAIEESQGLEE